MGLGCGSLSDILELASLWPSPRRRVRARGRDGCRDRIDSVRVIAGKLRGDWWADVGLLMRRLTVFDWLRAVSKRSVRAAVIVANVVVCELGARIGLPGVDGDRVRGFFRGAHLGLLGLYNLLVGGGLSRAAILALGVLPFLQAKLYLWLAREASPTLRRVTEEPAARRSVVRVATVILAALQSFGFARFLQGIPGAVSDPGAGFVSRTVLLLTAGAVAVGWSAELLAGPMKSASPNDRRELHVEASSAVQPLARAGSVLSL